MLLQEAASELVGGAFFRERHTSICEQSPSLPAPFPSPYNTPCRPLGRQGQDAGGLVETNSDGRHRQGAVSAFECMGQHTSECLPIPVSSLASEVSELEAFAAFKGC